MGDETIDLSEGTGSQLALALRDAIRGNLERHPERLNSLRALRTRVLVCADDSEEVVTLDFVSGRVRLRDGEIETAPIRILGDRETILALTRLRLARGLPDVRSPETRLVLRRQLGGELTVRGLFLHLPQIRHLLRVLAGG